MRSNYTHIGLAKICDWFGITRQAYYKNNWEAVTTTLGEEIVIKQIKCIRKNHPLSIGSIAILTQITL
jgi:hypothetical protein